MKPRVIEGPWEEVAQRGAELAGHRVRVTVLDDPSVSGVSGAPETLGETTETAFDILRGAGLIGCLKATPEAPTDLATNPAHLEGLGHD